MSIETENKDIKGRMRASFVSSDDFLLSKLLMENPYVADQVIEASAQYDKSYTFLRDLAKKGIVGIAADRLRDFYCEERHIDIIWTEVMIYISAEAAKRLYPKSVGNLDDFIRKCIVATDMEVGVIKKVIERKKVIGDRALNSLVGRGGMLDRYRNVEEILLKTDHK